MKMKRAKIILTMLISSLFPITHALAENEHTHGHAGGDPMLTRVIIDQLELIDTDINSTSAIEAQAWIGHDLHKLWFKTSAEKSDGQTINAEIQVLYSEAVTPFWDVQAGVRHDNQPSPDKNWAVIGFQGIAPYFVNIDTSVFLGESGAIAARFSAEYDLLFTQRLILTPNIELNLYGQNDVESATESGFSDTKAGLRLRYEKSREFAPYIGVNNDNEWLLGFRVLL